MLSFLVHPLLTQLLHQQTSYCTNQLFRTTPIGFCLKQNFITNKQSSQVITNLRNDSYTFFFSIYTEKTQGVNFNLQFDLQQKPSFALIGEIEVINISDSAMNVSVQNELAYGALICIQCSGEITKSSLAFVGSAQYISGIFLLINKQLLTTNSLVQFRLKGQYLGGLICITKQTSELIIKLISSNIIGYDIQSYQSGNLISNMTLNEILPIYFSSVYICTNIKNDIGKGNVIYSELPVKYCNICNAQYYVYGLCLDSLEFSMMNIKTVQNPVVNHPLKYKKQIPLSNLIQYSTTELNSTRVYTIFQKTIYPNQYPVNFSKIPGNPHRIQISKNFSKNFSKILDNSHRKSISRKFYRKIPQDAANPEVLRSAGRSGIAVGWNCLEIDFSSIIQESTLLFQLYIKCHKITYHIMNFKNKIHG
ncbi:Hypothetical_protein [Hexamita inflata]|uniref:Hypothetical_protein n=1 Tax=Hexamita inflata TaxID=28002 RepID=A0ABP1GX40_9EUKA